jgi:Holliday junction resolvase RusA-like endonuclease
MSEFGRQVLGSELTGGGVRVSVSGRPRTKGSLVPVHVRVGPGKCRVTLRESGEYSESWKLETVRAIRAQCIVERFAGPVVVDMFSRFEKLCEPDHGMLWPTREGGTYGHGDEDKLRRNVLDALTQSGLILDDSNVVGGQSWKRWTMGGESAGVLIKVRPAEIGDLHAILAAECGL